MLNGLETAVYYAEDVKAAGAWYRKVLGIEPNYDSEYYVGFTVGGHELGLHPGKGTLLSTAPPRQTAYWSVSNIQDAWSHFLKHGARAQDAPHDVGGGIQIGAVLDPFGNVIGLIQNPKSPNKR